MPRLLFSLLFLCLLAFTAAAGAQSPAITLTPAIVVAGAPEIVRMEAPDAVAVTGEWLGRKLEFFRARNGSTWIALAGVDVEASAGTSDLRISLQTAGSGVRTLSRAIEIHPAPYRTESISVAPRFVEPDAEAQAQIKAEAQLKKQLFAASVPEPLWKAGFRAPVPSRPTDSFGTRRMFNGKLASIHMGMDFRARPGTPVRASNGGIVVLARPLYYEGNCVILDHGQGFFTLSMHLSRIDVREGQHVVTGSRLGLSGATGRVTGPHLHWAVRWQGANLDPAKLLRLNLAALP